MSSIQSCLENYLQKQYLTQLLITVLQAVSGDDLERNKRKLPDATLEAKNAVLGFVFGVSIILKYFLQIFAYYNKHINNKFYCTENRQFPRHQNTCHRTAGSRQHREKQAVGH